jgi:hypothetical protein
MIVGTGVPQKNKKKCFFLKNLFSNLNGVDMTGQQLTGKI